MEDIDTKINSVESENDDPKLPEKKSVMREVIEYLEIFVFAICFVVVLFSCFARLCVVDGPSMEDTLYHQENLLISDFAYAPKVGDIVVFHLTGDVYNKPIVKRVIAVAGETVHIEYGYHEMKITVVGTDGVSRVIDEPYVKMVDTDRYSSPMTVTVEEGTIFVLGDNRNHSSDSRTSDIGLVDTRRILGRVVFRVFPFSRFGTVK